MLEFEYEHAVDDVDADVGAGAGVDVDVDVDVVEPLLVRALYARIIRKSIHFLRFCMILPTDRST